MKATVSGLLDLLDQFAPFSLAEEWDNVGLLIGHPQREVKSILIGLDPTIALLDEAVERGADTLITHHPVIFHPLSSVTTDTPDGRFLEAALARHMNVIACHTNLDSASNGVSDVLAAGLGLTQVTPLLPSSKVPGCGIGRVGVCAPPIKGAEFMARLFSLLACPSVAMAGCLPEVITTVAVCGGSGSDLAEAARSRGADVYLSAEIKHSTARLAQENGWCIIDGGHYFTEQPVVAFLADCLQRLAQESGCPWQIMQSEAECPPFSNINSKSSQL
ncbi:MAG: Nif3-like dinuclear metal center hexameric protein [Desulfobulbaceae bacterium]|uniref:GTP cyclohydrolase 1 type 2 homolog n=1 Tax=Candidatus Desulfatifera sulfidica TaxID=2841691 RepID=A0A8J6N7Z3_9BACT|nr:Nif3-like dinuclear metal center hexameric protein [Candidatus Desulfatifera sulfidica]